MSDSPTPTRLNQRAELIDSITRKLKFIKSYRKKEDLKRLESKSDDELIEYDKYLDILVRIHSNPFDNLRSSHLSWGFFDPDWEPFYNRLKQIIGHHSGFWNRIKLRLLLRHLASSKLLMNYMNTYLVLSADRKNGQLDTKKFYTVRNELFKKCHLYPLLHKVPMQFTDAEIDQMTAVLQMCRNPKNFAKKSMFEYITIAARDGGHEIKIATPPFALLFFGKKSLSLSEYGDGFAETLLGIFLGKDHK